MLIAPAVVADEGTYTIRYAALTAERAETPREATSTVLVEAAKQMSVQLAGRIDPASAASVRARYSSDNVANMLYAMGTEEYRRSGPLVASHYFTLCVDRDPDFIAAKMMLAECHKKMAENERAHRLLDEALALARARNDRESLARALVTRTNWLVEAGDYPGAERAGNESLRIARAANENEWIAAALTGLGYASWRSGQLDRAKTQFQEALRIYTAKRDLLQQARLYNNLGIIEDSAGRDGQRMYETALAIANRINDRLNIATFSGNLAGSYGTKGDFARAEVMGRRQVALARELDDSSTELFAVMNLGIYLWAQGKEREGVEMTEQAAAIARKLANPAVEAWLLSNLGTAYTKLGDLEAARRNNDAAAAKMAGIDDPEIDRDVQISRAHMLIREGKLAEAGRALDRAERWQANARCFVMRARLAYAQRNYKRAFELISRAKKMNDTWLLQNEQMYRAFEESARTGRESTQAFESPLT